MYRLLEGHHLELIRTFYSRLFERYPRYSSLFPKEFDKHMPRMVQTFTIVSRLGDYPDVTEAHLYKLGQNHRQFGLVEQDMNNFKEVFLEVLAEFSGPTWSNECSVVWNEVFDTKVLPQVMTGLNAAN